MHLGDGLLIIADVEVQLMTSGITIHHRSEVAKRKSSMPQALTMLPMHHKNASP